MDLGTFIVGFIIGFICSGILLAGGMAMKVAEGERKAWIDAIGVFVNLQQEHAKWHEEERKHREQDSQRAAEACPHGPTEAVDEADREAKRGRDREEPAFACERAVERGTDARSDSEDDEATDRDLAAQPTIKCGRVPCEAAHAKFPCGACEERRDDSRDEEHDRPGDPRIRVGARGDGPERATQR